MASLNIFDAARLSPSGVSMVKKKTKVLRGGTAKKVLAREASKKSDPIQKIRTQAEKRNALYGKN